MTERMSAQEIMQELRATKDNPLGWLAAAEIERLLAMLSIYRGGIDTILRAAKACRDLEQEAPK